MDPTVLFTHLKEVKTFYDIAQVPMIKQIYLDFLILNIAILILP